MWYKAAHFTTQAEARGVWKQVHDALTPLDVSLTTISIIYEGKWYVVTIGERVPNMDAQGAINRHLSKGTYAELPESVLKSLIKRRRDRNPDAKHVKGVPSRLYEGHTPVPVQTEDSSSKDSETVNKHMRVVVDSMYEQGYPFIAIYTMYVGYRLGYNVGMVGSGNPLKETVKQALTSADRYLFTETARHMHMVVYQEDTTFIPMGDSLWIEQDVPQPFTALGVNIKAVHVFKTGKEQWCINVIEDTTRHVMSMVWDTESKEYEPTIDYECPYGLCEDIQEEYTSRGPNNYLVYRKPCVGCQKNAVMWASWLHTAVEMIQKKYAISSTPKDFKKRTLSYTEKRLVERHHGKGKPKEKTFTIDVPYTVISYEVSITPGTYTPGATPDSTHSKKEGWLTLHSQEDRVYVKRYVPDDERHYRGERFERLKKRILTEGTVTEDGREYRIEEDTETHEIVIVGKVVGYHKYVPMLKAEARKRPVIREVTAKRFQRPTN